MNCCDYNCHQGRNCPARAARVAPIGRKDYDREPLPPSMWRVYLGHLAKWMLLTIAGLLWLALLIVMATPSEPRKLDCAVSEFHPDFPLQARSQCRQLRAKP